MATAALVLSLLGLVTCGVTALIGVPLGVVAYRETRTDVVAGKTQAIVAILVGGFLGLPLLVGAVLVVAGLASAPPTSP